MAWYDHPDLVPALRVIAKPCYAVFVSSADGRVVVSESHHELIDVSALAREGLESRSSADSSFCVVARQRAGAALTTVALSDDWYIGVLAKESGVELLAGPLSEAFGRIFQIFASAKPMMMPDPSSSGGSGAEAFALPPTSKRLPPS